MNEQLKKISENYQNAINDVDGRLAFWTIKDITEFIAKNDLAQKDPALLKKLQKALIYLKLVGISFIPDEEVYTVIREHYLDSFVIDISMENLITARLFGVPFLLRDEDRKKIRSALSQNEQSLGDTSVKNLISEFNNEYDPTYRDFSDVKKFVDKISITHKLDPKEKTTLYKILHTYDYILSATLPSTGKNLENFLKSLDESENKNSSPYKESEPRELSEKASSRLEILTIDEILNKYPQSGEQLVTSSKIKIGSFPDYVFPSVKNWLTDYSFNLGEGKHDSMERSAYLFQSPNGKKLSPMDRQKLSLLLKAKDENLPLSLDRISNKIIFSEFKIKTNNDFSLEKKDVFSDRNEKIHDYKPEEKIHISPREEESVNKINASNIKSARFSSSQSLPFEKKTPANEDRHGEINLPKKQFLEPKKIEPIQSKVNSPSKNFIPEEKEKRQPLQEIKESVNFSEELKRIRDNAQKNKNDVTSQNKKTVNVINLKDLL